MVFSKKLCYNIKKGLILKININKSDYKNLYTILFGNNNVSNSILEKIINQFLTFKIDQSIETTSYPFVIEDKIEINLRDIEKQNLYKMLYKLDLKEVEMFIELNNIKEKSMNKLTAIYNGDKIKIQNFAQLIFENNNSSTNLYIKIIISDFAKKEEGKIKDYCYTKVDEHVTKIAGGKGKSASQNKTNSKKVGGPK
jgi:hypothetical protein